MLYRGSVKKRKQSTKTQKTTNIKKERITGLKVLVSPYASGLNAHFGDRGQPGKQPTKRPRQRAGIITDSCPQVSRYALRNLMAGPHRFTKYVFHK